ncbi:hypothetical protein ACWCP6_31835 [Streptomyces sp. NPDC002004]
MGWTVLYIAFGFVALWLLGEVLLQYKARLRWRLLAFVGFLGVVVGVLMPSVVVIGIGAAAFAVGQTYVTLSFRRGFSTGWAVGGRPGSSKRRRSESRDAGRQEPTLEVSGLEYDGADDGPEGSEASWEAAPSAGQVYEPEPLPEDTGTYGVYGDSPYGSDGEAAYAAAAAAQQTDYGYGTYAGYDQQQYGYDAGQQQYAAYSDPYIGTQSYGGQQAYDTYGGQQPYEQAGFAQDPYATGAYAPTSASETPPGGVWVPQQRSDDQTTYGGELPPEQSYPYQGQAQGHSEYGSGYEQQPYRY